MAVQGFRGHKPYPRRFYNYRGMHSIIRIECYSFAGPTHALFYVFPIHFCTCTISELIVRFKCLAPFPIKCWQQICHLMHKFHWISLRPWGFLLSRSVLWLCVYANTIPFTIKLTHVYSKNMPKHVQVRTLQIVTTLIQPRHKVQYICKVYITHCISSEYRTHS